MKELPYKEIQYEQAHNLLRFQLDMRSQTLNFALLFNGALFTIVFEYLSELTPKILISILGLVRPCLGYKHKFFEKMGMVR